MADHFRATPPFSYSHKAVTARTHSACESRAVAWPSGPTRTTPAATQSARAGPPRPRAALIRRTAAAPDSDRCAPRVRYSTRRHMCQAPDMPGPPGRVDRAVPDGPPEPAKQERFHWANTYRPAACPRGSASVSFAQPDSGTGPGPSDDYPPGLPGPGALRTPLPPSISYRPAACPRGSASVSFAQPGSGYASWHEPGTPAGPARQGPGGPH